MACSSAMDSGVVSAYDWSDDEGLSSAFADLAGPHLFTLQLPNKNSRHMLATIAASAPSNCMVWTGDSAASVHGLGDGTHVYNRRAPMSGEEYLALGDGRVIRVDYYGDLDLHVKTESDWFPATLMGCAVAKDLKYNLWSLNIMQETNTLLLNRKGAWGLGELGGGRLFKKFPYGNYAIARPVAHHTSAPPATTFPPAPMAASMMRLDRQTMENISDLHLNLAHANERSVRATAERMGIKVTGKAEYCSGCAISKAIKRDVPKTLAAERKPERPLERIGIGLAGPKPTSVGNDQYCMVFVDHFTGMGWLAFLKDESAKSVDDAFKNWHVNITPLRLKRGGVVLVLSDNGAEYNNDMFRQLMMELDICQEFTPAHGVKRNGIAERRLALVAEGGRTWEEFPRRFPGVTFPSVSMDFNAIWPESWMWWSEAYNKVSRVGDKPSMLSPYEKTYGKPPPRSAAVHDAWSPQSPPHEQVRHEG